MLCVGAQALLNQLPPLLKSTLFKVFSFFCFSLLPVCYQVVICSLLECGDLTKS